MSLVRYSETRKVILLHKLCVLSVYCGHGFCVEFLYKFDVCMIGKKYIEIFICKHKQVKSIFFAVSIKFCNKSDLGITTFRSPGRGSSARTISYRSYSKNILFCLNSFKLLDVDNTDEVCSNDKLGSVHQNCKFHDPLGMIKIMYNVDNANQK